MSSSRKVIGWLALYRKPATAGVVWRSHRSCHCLWWILARACPWKPRVGYRWARVSKSGDSVASLSTTPIGHCSGRLAERQGFEPWVPARTHLISSQAHSAALAPLRGGDCRSVLTAVHRPGAATLGNPSPRPEWRTRTGVPVRGRPRTMTLAARRVAPRDATVAG